jgi:hypothetical protein
MVPPTPEAVHISLPVPAAVWRTSTMAGPVGHALPVSWLAAPQQLAPGRDLDLSHTEASHAGQDAGLQGRSHNARGLAEDHARQGARGASPPPHSRPPTQPVLKLFGDPPRS